MDDDDDGWLFDATDECDSSMEDEDDGSLFDSAGGDALPDLVDAAVDADALPDLPEPSCRSPPPGPDFPERFIPFRCRSNNLCFFISLFGLCILKCFGSAPTTSGRYIAVAIIMTHIDIDATIPAQGLHRCILLLRALMRMAAWSPILC